MPVVRVQSAGVTLYYLGDLIHHSIEVVHPDWMPLWADPASTAASRQAIFSAALAEDALLVASHILAGIPPTRALALSREQQFAEKIHAYTLPRGERMNTRVKDLVDLVLLLRLGLPDRDAVRWALHATFEHRATHPLPETLDPPPADWQAVFEHLAPEVDLGTMRLDTAFDEVAGYWRTLVP